MKQAKIAMGDFANNLESPSNQMKIFKQQLVETKVALTSLFIGTFANIMPYANAFLMTIKEISKAIATMFGIELKDYNTGIASQEGIYDGIEDSANGASKAVKELRRQTLGFDEIHNINENKDNNSGTSVNGGIDQRLLDAIKGYDNGMDKVRMKATEIRDKWMEILGFTKNTNEETGEVYFTYGGVSKTLEGVFNWFKKLNTQGKIFGGLGIAIGITKVFNIGQKLMKLISGDKAVKIIVDNVPKLIPKLIKAINPLTLLIGGLVGGLGYVYSKNEEVRVSVDKLAKTFCENLNPLFELVTNTILPDLKNAWDELLTSLQPLRTFIENVFISIWNDMLIPVLQLLSDTIIPGVTKTFENLWTNVLVPLGKFANSVLKPIIERLSEVLKILWENILVPFSDFLIESFKVAWDGVYNVLNDTIIPIFEGVIKVADYLWKNVLEPITNFLFSTFKPAFETVCKGIGEIFGGLKQTFGGVITFIKGVFTLDWKTAWTGVRDTFSGIWKTLSTVVSTPLNAVLALFEGLINKIIDGWNFLKKQINKLSLEVPDWIPGVGGEKIGFNLEMSAHTKIPRFANGGTPEDGLFYANHKELVGKFSNGNTAVANNLQIEKGIEEAAYRGYMRAIADSGINSSQTSEIDLHLHTDEGVVVDRINQKTRQTGVCPIELPTY